MNKCKHECTLYDTTLRDGTQGAGISFSLIDKLKIAEILSEFGISYIEGGWPSSNPKDLAFFEAAKHHLTPEAKKKLVAFGSTCRAHTLAKEDPQISALLKAETDIITIFGKNSKLHIEKVLGVSIEENQKMIFDSIAYLKDSGKEVFYDAEHFFDGYKDDPYLATKIVEIALSAGADMVILCDTNGGTLPHEILTITEHLIQNFSHQIGIHTHNDCGTAVANALAAVQVGATQIQGTINGYGERTGNCNLTTLIPCLQLKMGIQLIPDISKLRSLSLIMDDIANCQQDLQAPFVGRYAFSHKGGIHVNAVVKISEAYEHIKPELVGNRQNILISELSGRSNIILKAKELGKKIVPDDPVILKILDKVKKLELEGFIFESADASLDILIRKEIGNYQPLFRLISYNCTFYRDALKQSSACLAVITLDINERIIEKSAMGDGPVNALDAALRETLKTIYTWINEIILIDYKVRIVDGSLGTAARTRVQITSTDGKSTWTTVGVSDNIIEASWMALVDSLEYKNLLI